MNVGTMSGPLDPAHGESDAPGRAGVFSPRVVARLLSSLGQAGRRAVAGAMLAAGAIPLPADAARLERMPACTPRSATLILIEEGLLTRTAVTAATAAQYSTPVEIPAGDRRLTGLDALLRALPLRPPRLPQFEPRLLVRVACTDGAMLEMEGAATGPDGTMHVRIGDAAASTTAPLRRDLAVLAGRPR